MKTKTTDKKDNIRVHLTARVHPEARKGLLAFAKKEGVNGAGQAFDRLYEKYFKVELPPLNEKKAVVVKPKAAAKPKAKKPAKPAPAPAAVPAKKLTPVVIKAIVHGGPVVRPASDRQPILRPSERAAKAKA